ncbi:uncharacterized protein TNCV_3346021 [Trichonephila clavipes]|nr:uncharacterized protein TNCV_3346021 [Trichonephila clavipes]
MDFTEINSRGKRKELLRRIDRQNSLFRTAKTTIIKFGLHASFVELESAKSALIELLMCGEALNNDERDFTFNGVDYKTSVIDTARRFIQPSLKENHMLVLPPNGTTLFGLDIIKVEDSTLRRTADFADHSIPYLRYLIGLNKDVPKCVRCCNAESTEITFKDIVSKMKSRLVVIDEDMETAIKIETGQVAVQKQKCCCEELACSKNVVDLLTKRFLSLFFWPFLISSVDLNQEQEKYLKKRKNALLESEIHAAFAGNSPGMRLLEGPSGDFPFLLEPLQLKFWRLSLQQLALTFWIMGKNPCLITLQRIPTNLARLLCILTCPNICLYGTAFGHQTELNLQSP